MDLNFDLVNNTKTLGPQFNSYSIGNMKSGGKMLKRIKTKNRHNKICSLVVMAAMPFPCNGILLIFSIYLGSDQVLFKCTVMCSGDPR